MATTLRQGSRGPEVRRLQTPFAYHVLVGAEERILARVSTTAIPIINKGFFENVLVAKPRYEEHKAVAMALVAVDDACDSNSAKLQALASLEASRMPVLLTGELRVTPDESAA